NPTVQLAGGPAVTSLEGIIPNNQTLDNFSGASAFAVFDAVGGDAAIAFHTCAFHADPIAGASCPPGYVDAIFGESFSSVASGDFPVSGSANVKANVHIPEPLTLAMFGTGLLGIGFMVRRRRENKKI